DGIRDFHVTGVQTCALPIFPGIAGLVLSVGMSVDANILIFERIREELARGSKIRMALRNGFARATTTIIDSNVTTLITGVVLYEIGRASCRRELEATGGGQG